MCPQTDYSTNYLLYNSESTKNIVIAVEIEGLNTLLTSTTVYKKIHYGDPGIVYGLPGIVYGGGIPYGDGLHDQKSLLDLTGSSLTLSQRLEPEQGRGAVSTLSMSFIDLDQFMTKVISPGVLIDDILGKPVKVYLGYQEIFFPQDYTIIFRGRVSAYSAESGRVNLQFSDPNMARRQQILYMGKTVLSSSISNSDTSIPVVQTTDFFQQILGPDFTYDPAIKTFIKINDEVIEYPATGIAASSFSGVTRGARGTVAVSHNSGETVDASIEITDHAIDMALKFMLSGWEGPYIEQIPITDFAYSPDPLVGSQPGLLILGNNKSADRDYGISTGDYLTISGAASAGNNGTFRALQFIDINGQPSNGIITDTIFTQETSSPSAVMSVRSQYDTYPKGVGVKLPGTEVDVAQHVYIKDTFMGSDENKLRFYFDTQEDSCKTFIENQIYLPCGLYSLTRFGKLSVQLTHAPLADQRLQFLSGENVLFPQNIRPSRGVNNRKFFNQIDWSYDYLDDNSTPLKRLKQLDTDSINIIGVSSVLPIDGKGIRSEFGTETVINRRTNYLLSRYKNGAILMDIQVNWEVGCLIEAGDVVAVKDNGVLQISNLVTGSRNLGTQLFEVINREMDLKSANVKLTLVSGLGAEATDRYATISPSSILQAGSINTQIIISDSYGALYPTQEYRKWQDYQGIRVKIHDDDYTISATATIASFDSVNPNVINIAGLSIPSSALPGLIMDIDDYSLSTDIYDQQAVKAVHAYQSPRVTITGGVSASAFTVSPSDIDKFSVGFPISVHDYSFTVAAKETTVSSVDIGTNTIMTSADLGFIPASGYFAELLGFADGTASYRLI